MIVLPVIEGATVLDHLLQHGVPLPHECEATGACGTCIVVVREGGGSLCAVNDDELDLLDKSCATEPGSRLACRAIANGGDLTIEIPEPAAPRLIAESRGVALPVALSEAAAAYLAAQLAKRGARAAVRFGVVASGCSGLRYEVSYADTLTAHDAVFETGGIRIAVAPESLPFVAGTVVDLAREGFSRRLRFDNPNARRTCGCGESFGS